MAEQDRQERIEIRNDYRHLLHDTNLNRDEYLSPETGLKRMHTALNRTNEIFNRVQMPREAVMDSQVIAALSEVAVQHAQSLRTEFVTFQPNEFAQKLMTYLKVPRIDVENTRITDDKWAELGGLVQPYFRKTPSIDYMFGAFERGPPKKKARQERRKADKETIQKNAVVPRQVTNIRETERREATTAEVENILGSLHFHYSNWNQQPICYFEFVVNPHSFTQTVENIFYTSFLVRDGHAHIFLDDDKLPVIEPIKKGKDGDADQKRHQVVIAMSKEKWTDIIKTFQIKDPLIKTRQPVQQ